MVKACPLKEDNSCNIPTTTCNHYNGCVGRHGVKQNCNLKSRQAKEREELRTLYKQLREVIPSCKAKPLSSVDIVFHAVDYINQLHQMLDEEFPGAPRPFPELSLPPTLNDHMIASNNSRNSSFRDVTNVTVSTTLQTTARLRD